MDSLVKGKNILIYDYGSGVEHALRLARDGAKVKIFTSWAQSAPEFQDMAPGLGYEKEGVEKSRYFWNDIDWSDMIMFDDIGAGDICTYLKKTTDKPIYGAGFEGEKLEADRWYAKQLQAQLGLPVQGSARVIGVPALRQYLLKHKNQHVKINIFRGNMESFSVKDEKFVDLYLKEIEVSLGPFSETFEFIVEDHVDDAIEMGWDLFFDGKDWVKPYLWGTSGATYSYLGKYSNTLPKPLQLIADKLKPLLIERDYKGAISIEALITKEGKPYLIDICSRFPIPMSNLFTESIKNYSNVIWSIANNIPVKIDPIATYIGCVSLQIEKGEKHWTELSFDESKRKNIKTRISAKLNNHYYSIAGTDIVYVILGWGKTIDHTQNMIKEMADKADAHRIDKNSLFDLEKTKDIMSESNEYKLGIF